MFRKFLDSMEQWLAQKQQAAQQWFVDARYKMQHLPETNFDLGLKFAERGKVHDAIFRFQFALKLRPNWAEAWYQLGLCHMRIAKNDQAAKAFQKTLSLDPARVDAQYLLAVVAPNAMPQEKLPKVMPPRIVQSFFTDVGAEYALIEQQNKYAGDVKIIEALRDHLPQLEGLRVTDAGCGIGHLAMRWRKVADHLIGVDYTDAMIAQAKTAFTAEQETLFDEAIHGDITQLSKHVEPASQDVILCGNVLQFVGDLGDVLREFATCLKPGGLLAITVEPHQGNGFGIVPTSARFGHSAAYIQQMAEHSGLQIKDQQKTEIYPKMPCLLVVLQKSGEWVASVPIAKRSAQPPQEGQAETMPAGQTDSAVEEV